MTGQGILSPQMKRDAILQLLDFFQKKLIRHSDFADLGEQRFLFGIGRFVGFLRFQRRFRTRQYLVSPFRQLVQTDAVFPRYRIKRLAAKDAHNCIQLAGGCPAARSRAHSVRPLGDSLRGPGCSMNQSVFLEHTFSFSQKITSGKCPRKFRRGPNDMSSRYPCYKIIISD